MSVLKNIFEVNTLTLQTQNALQNKHQPDCVPMVHCIIKVQRLRIQSLPDTLAQKRTCLEFHDSTIRFPLEHEGPCFWKQILSID